MQPLDHNAITEIFQATVSVGLDRETLLSGLPPSVVASLPVRRTTAEQLFSDLHALNRFGELPGGQVPLGLWLQNAVALSAGRVGHGVFVRHAAQRNPNAPQVYTETSPPGGALESFRKASDYQYDVALSFAGEDRPIAESLADLLKASRVRVFYDLYEQAELWGKDLYQHLQSVYRDKARFCIIFVSDAYARKLWTRHELRQAQERAFAANAEYILPIRVDDTSLPGMNSTIGYIDVRTTSVSAISSFVLRKLQASE